MAGWTVLPLLLYPFTDILAIGKARLLHSAIEIPLAVTATYAIVSIFPKYIPKFVLALITAAFILYSFTMIGLQGKVLWDKAMQEYTWYSLIYVPKEYMETIDEVSKVVPQDAHMLTGDVFGNLLPDFQPIVNYIGSATQTYKWDEKLATAKQFYSNAMTNKEARQFLSNNGITFVINDQETKQWESQPLVYPFLQPMWHNALVTLYKVE